jgi:tripartite-type tricarboxylate transporter receptor subunit TctC
VATQKTIFSAILRGGLALSAFAALGITAPAQAADFYAGKTMTVIAGYGAGSTYDANARWIARNMKRFIPGEPNMIVQNMPGAGTLTAANYVENIAPKDGTFMVLVARGMAIEPLLGGKGVRYDPQKINWIGSTAREVSVIIVRADTGVKTLEDATKRQIAVASSGIGTDGYTYPTVLNNLLGTKFKIVLGYQSGKEMALALERKEVEGRGSWSWSSFKREALPRLKSGEYVILVQMAPHKSPELPDVPLVMDYAKTDEQKQILELLLAGQSMAWPYFVASAVPQERVALLRTAFQAVLKDPQALAEANKLQIDIEPVTGEEMTAKIKQLYALPKPIVQKVRELAGRT